MTASIVHASSREPITPAPVPAWIARGARRQVQGQLWERISGASIDPRIGGVEKFVVEWEPALMAPFGPAGLSANVDPRKLEDYDENASDLDEPVDPREEYDPIDSFESLDN